METIYIIIGIVALAIGFGIAKIIEKQRASGTIKNSKRAASRIIKEAKTEAESIKKDKILQAKEKFIELKSNHEKVILSREKKMVDVEKRIRDKESKLSQELNKNKKANQEIQAKIKDYDYRLEFLEKKKKEAEKMFYQTI